MMTRLMPEQIGFIPGAKRPDIEHANRGMGLEKQIIAINDLYKLLGVAWVDKTNVKTTVIGNGFARVDGKGPVDFLGTMAPNGRTVAFDCKDCAERRINLDRLEPHQLEQLERIHAIGGKAFILVRFVYSDVFAVPVDYWTSAEMYRTYGKPIELVDGWKPKNAASICETDMKPEWAVRDYDYLGALNNATD